MTFLLISKYDMNDSMCIERLTDKKVKYQVRRNVLDISLNLL